MERITPTPKLWLDPCGVVDGIEYVNVVDAEWNPIEYEIPLTNAQRDYRQASYGRSED